jgi:outer membrane lipoprotein-sorting protein
MKNLKQNFFFLSLAFLFVSPVFAQDVLRDTSIFEHALNADTKPQFLAACARVAAEPVVRGTFEQAKTIAKIKRTIRSSGTFVIAADRGMLWETEKPFPSVMVLGRDSIIQIVDGSKSVLSAQGNETFSRMADIISAVFQGRAQTLQENFSCFFVGGASWQLGLIPKDSTVKQFAGRFILDGKGPAIMRIETDEQNGNSIVYQLSNQSFGKELSPQEEALFNAQ